MRAILVGGPAHGTSVEITEVTARLYVPVPTEKTIERWGGDQVTVDTPEVMEYSHLRLRNLPQPPNGEFYAATDTEIDLQMLGDARRAALTREREERERKARAELVAAERRRLKALPLVDGRDVTGLTPGRWYRRDRLADGTVIFRPEEF